MQTPILIFVVFSVLISIAGLTNGNVLWKRESIECNETSTEPSQSPSTNISLSTGSSGSGGYFIQDGESKEESMVSLSLGDSPTQTTTTTDSTTDSDLKVAVIGTLLDTEKAYSPYASCFPYGESYSTGYTSEFFNGRRFSGFPYFLHVSSFKRNWHSQRRAIPSSVFEIRTFSPNGLLLAMPDDDPFSTEYAIPSSYKSGDGLLQSFQSFSPFESQPRDWFHFSKSMSSSQFHPFLFASPSRDNKYTPHQSLPSTTRDARKNFPMLATYNMKNEEISGTLFIVCRMNLNGDLLPSAIPIRWCDYLLLDGFTIGVNRLEYPPALRDKRQILIELMNLKNTSNVKLFASVKNTFSNIAPHLSNRQRFVDSAVRLLRESRFDGLDVDWEWTVGGPEKKEMITLLENLKQKFSRRKKPYMLSATVGATVESYSKSYDAIALSRLVAFVNIKSYDFFYYHSRRTRLAYPSPLFPWSSDDDEVKIKNLAASAKSWCSAGIPKSKIMVTISTFGRTYRLRNSKYTEINSPATGEGFNDGILSYFEACEFLKRGASQKFDYRSKVPYAFNSTDWVGYENRESVVSKATWIMNNGFGGITVQNLNTDDWGGQCDGQKFPLLGAIYRTIKQRVQFGS